VASSIFIANYDPAWPGTYAAEERRIRRALAGRLVAIEHAGSTSVPGLGAKPIVDILAGTKSLSDASDCAGALEVIGYEFRPEVAIRLPDTRMFVKCAGARELVHLHLTEHDAPFWRDKLVFRDFLRSHPDVAREYEALKRRLAPHFSAGPPYSEAKSDFIRAVLQLARLTAREGA
jgi:GrpB-like predicted nucleotidyltransferase (UPF0157 family)